MKPEFKLKSPDQAAAELINDAIRRADNPDSIVASGPASAMIALTLIEQSEEARFEATRVASANFTRIIPAPRQ
jgi:inosine-uridine nucleoside N-ribohydrolase